MTTEKIIADAMNELKMADVYEDMASQLRYKARKLLESVSPNCSPAPPGRKKPVLTKAQEDQLVANRRRTLARRAIK